MSQAEALLNDLTETTASHKHVVPDSDTHFIIDPYTRQIENTNYNKTVLMQGDHNSERFTFEVPRYVDGHDMSLCNRVIVHFDNIGETSYDINSDVAYMTDLHINPDKPDTVISSWLIRREATQIVGILSFSLQYQCIENEEVTYEWNTDSYDGIEIRKSKNNGAAAVVQYSNVLEEWRSQIFGAGDSVMTNITTEGASQVAAVQAEGANQRGYIEIKGTDTLATIPDDYTEIYNMASEAVRTKADSVVCEAEGTVITVADSANDPIRGLNVYGESTQVVTTGKNLFDIDGWLTDSGITWSKTGHKYTINTKTPIYNTPYVFSDVDVEITLSCALTNKTTVNARFELLDSSDNIVGYFYEEHSSHTCTASKIRINWTTTGDVEISAPQIELGSTATTYEPYSGGDPSPSPEYPQKINSIENPTVSVHGKNLLNADNLVGGTFVKENGVYTFTKLENSATSATYTLNLPAGDYVLSWGEIERTAESYRMYINYADGTNQLTGLTNLGTNNLKISTKAGIKDIRLSLASNVTTDTYVKFAWWQLESGTEATAYEPYIETQTITLANTLHGIPVTSGGNYTDENGQQWICDEVDLERGVYINRVYEESYDGSEVERWKKSNESYFYIPRTSMIHPSKPNCRAMSNRFRFATGSLVESGLLTFGNAYGPMLRVTSDVTDETALRSWIANHPFNVVYELATPIETPLTAEEIKAFKSLRSNYPNTTILTDAGAWMKVKYNADTKLYIAEMADNRASSLVEEIMNETY